MKGGKLVFGLMLISALSFVLVVGVSAASTVVDLDNSSTFGSAVVYAGGKYYFNENVTLVEKTYINKRLVVNASGVTLDGNGATLDGYYQGNAIWIEGEAGCGGEGLLHQGVRVWDRRLLQHGGHP